MSQLIKVNTPFKRVDDYSLLIPETVEEIKKTAKTLKGLKITHLNATSLGGGVAEMLYSLVPLQRDLGLDSNWLVLPPNQEFFEVTKEIHNFLQGKEGSLTEKQKEIYINYNQFIAQLLERISTDILIIHDPQPAASLTFLLHNKPQLALWRCHIDTSNPNERVWKFLLPFLNNFDHHVFTMKQFTHQEFPKEKLSFITPSIDPLSPKNIPFKKPDAQKYIKQFGINTAHPLVTQVSRLDPWKDPLGVVKAFLLAKNKIPALQLALVAQMASDDPEGVKVYEQVKDYIKERRDIFLLVNILDNDQAVNAFQTASDIILQKSIKEGFGLTVTEAMWKKSVVIGGNVGGIKLQIQDGDNGLLVSSVEETAEKIVYLLNHPNVCQKISQKARQSVKNKFLIPHKLLHYLYLFQNLLLKKQDQVSTEHFTSLQQIEELNI